MARSRVLLCLHFAQELEKFKFIIQKLNAEVVVATDMKPAYSNDERWWNTASWANGIEVKNFPLPSRPWYYHLARFIDDYRFFQNLPQSDYYKNRMIPESYRKYKWVFPFISWLPLAWLKRLYRPHRYLQDFISEFNPDLVITSSLAFPPFHIATELALIAQSKKIPVVCMIHNWDALTTKGKMYPVPDLTFCWNDFHEKELVSYHGISKSKIVKVGAFSLEEWFMPRKITPRDKFCEKYGLDPKKPFVTYLSSSQSIAGDELDAVEQVRDVLKDWQFVVRPHPDKLDTLSGIWGIITIPRSGEAPTDEEAFQLAYDTYIHSAALYAVNTTSMLEAMILGRPVYRISTDSPDTTDKCLHFQKLLPLLDGKGYEKIREWLGIGERKPSEVIIAVLKVSYPQLFD